MSSAAHRIESIVYKKESTFNLLYDEDLVIFLNRNTLGGIYHTLDEEQSGIIEIDVSLLKRALVELPELKDYIVKEIKDDIEWSEAEKNEYVQYYCN